MSIEEIKALIGLARESGCSEVTVEGVKYVIGHPVLGKPVEAVPDQKPEELVKPLSTFDEPDEQEVLYWSSPYYDTLMSQKEDQARKKASNVDG